MAESFTTRLIQRLQIEQKKNDHGGVYAFAQRTLAYHSNRIEGSTLTEKQTASLFDTGTPDVGRCADSRKRRRGNDRPLPDVQ